MKKYLQFGCVALTATLLVACSPVALLNSLVPTEGLVATRNIAYGTLNREMLDVYVPIVPTVSGAGLRSADAASAAATRGTEAGAGMQTPVATKRPVIIFFYGGSWDTGSKDAYLFVAEALTSKGFITVIPDYRVYPEVIYPEFLIDGAKAFRWTQTNIEKYGGDVNNIFIVGHSAGAHIAAMLAFDQTWLTQQKSDTSSIRGFIGLAGPYDFLPLTSARLKEIFPSPEIQALSQPIRYARSNAPSSLLLAGDADTIVGIKNTRNFSGKIRELGGRVQTKYYPGMGHIKIVAALAVPFRDGQTVLEDVAEFVWAESTVSHKAMSATTSSTMAR